MIQTEAHDQPVEEVRQVVASLLLGAHESVRISTAFSRDLLNDIRPAAETALDHVRTFEVLVDAGVDLHAKAEVYGSWLFCRPNVQVRQSATKIPHWIMVDKRDFRLEQEHDSGAERRTNLLIIDGVPKKVASFVEQFDERWRSASPVDCTKL